jgi:hypothetical protein
MMFATLNINPSYSSYAGHQLKLTDDFVYKKCIKGERAGFSLEIGYRVFWLSVVANKTIKAGR